MSVLLAGAARPKSHRPSTFTSHVFRDDCLAHWEELSQQWEAEEKAGGGEAATGEVCRFWGIRDVFGAGWRQQLNTPKWRTYLYLRALVLDFRRGVRARLNELLNWCSSASNKRSLANLLLDPVLCGEREHWGTSMHEWLERHQIVEVLKRSAGFYLTSNPPVWTGVTIPGEPEIDWLWVQAYLRSPNKYIIFKNGSNTIATGHIGALKPNLQKSGFATAQPDKTSGEKFHQLLDKAFEKSTTIPFFLRSVQGILRSETLSGNKHVALSGEAAKVFMVDGGNSNVHWHNVDFLKHSIKSLGYVPLRDRINQLRAVVQETSISDDSAVSSSFASDTSASLTSAHEASSSTSSHLEAVTPPARFASPAIQRSSSSGSDGSISVSASTRADPDASTSGLSSGQGSSDSDPTRRSASKRHNRRKSLDSPETVEEEDMNFKFALMSHQSLTEESTSCSEEKPRRCIKKGGRGKKF